MLTQRAAHLLRTLFPQRAPQMDEPVLDAAAFEATFEVGPEPEPIGAPSVVSLIDDEDLAETSQHKRRTVTVWIGNASFVAALI